MEKLVPDPFIKNQNWAYLLTNSLKCYKVCLIVCPSRGLPNIKTEVLTSCFCPIQSFFKKQKSSLELVSLPHFLHDFWREMFLRLYFINWPKCIAWLPFFLEILDNMCIVIICCPACDVINFEINHNFPIKPFFYETKKSGRKCNISRTKRAFNMK